MGEAEWGLWPKRELKVQGAFVYDLKGAHLGGRNDVLSVFDHIRGHPSPKIPQIMVSRSVKNVIRGMHLSPHQKMVSCPSGRAFDVVVDARPDSPTFLAWDGAWLDKDTVIIVPPFCFHGFFSAADDTTFIYVQGGTWVPALDFALNYADARVGVKWPDPLDGGEYVISPKDVGNPMWSDELGAALKGRIGNAAAAIELGSQAEWAVVSEDPAKAAGLASRLSSVFVCAGSGSKRETLEGELWAVKPKVGVAYAPAGGVVEAISVVSAANSMGFRVSVHGELPAGAKELLTASEANIEVVGS